MSYRSKLVVTALSVTSLCGGCASDQKNAEAPNQGASPEAPPDTAPRPGDANMPAPNGQPTEMPPAEGPPQGLNEGTRDNSVAAPHTGNQGASPADDTVQLSPGQVVMITELANNAEIEQGKLAQTKAKSASVRKFAQMMVKHHSEAKTEQTQLYRDLGLAAAQSQAATSLKESADRTTSSLRGSTGSAFDTAYMDSQVQEHQDLLDTIDHQLLPAASDERLVNGLKKMRGTVQAHLTEARTIQAELTTATK